MPVEHRYSYLTEDDTLIPSFFWHEKDANIIYSIPIGGSLVLDIGEDGRIVGFEIYDLNMGIDEESLNDRFKERDGVYKADTKEEMEEVEQD